MTDQEPSRPPLTRRELRLQQMAAAETEPGAAEDSFDDGGSGAAEAALPEQVAAAVADALANAEFEIPLLDESGRPRSRKELRELRQQAEAELTESVVSQTGSIDLGTGPLAWPVEDARQPADESSQVQEQSLESEAEPLESEAELLESVEEALEADVVEPALDVVEPESETVEPGLETVEPALEPIQPEPESFEPATAEAASEQTPEQQPRASWSFPDIAPLDENQSVFDDPTTRLIGAVGATDGSGAAQPVDDFDELITRAVAQEGAAGTTNTSALILPNMPGSDALSGPLGETGELFITGSFNLPKSLGETGGHASIHDSVEIEPLPDDLGFIEQTPTGSIMAPVSAARAVSARGSQGPLVAEATKDKSKLPAILISVGGVLVLGALDLIVWAAANGLFG